MSLIDSLSIHYSSARATKTFDGSQATFIKGCKSLLLGVGWTLVEELKASGSVNFPIGAPISNGVDTSPKRSVGCPSINFFLTVGGAQFSLYDPYHESPASGGSCTLVPISTTAFGTLTNLAGAVTLGSDFTASITQYSLTNFTMNLVAKQGGPDFNFEVIAGDGRWGTIGSNAGLTVGGGYNLQSVSDPTSTQYNLKLTGDQSIFGNLKFEFVIDSGSAFYNLTASGTYKIVANGYGFFLSNTAGEGSYPFLNYSMFVMASVRPVDENFSDSTVGVFILGPRTFQNQTYYYGAHGSISTAVDGPPATFGNIGGWPRVLCYRNPGLSLTSSDGKNIVFSAYATFGSGPTSSADIIGKLPDCAVTPTQLTPYGETEIGSQIFIVVSSQGGGSGETASSLLMFSPLQGPDPTPTVPPAPPVPDPIYPATQPSSRSGTCIVQSTGFVVQALTGNFTGLAHLSPITIAGAPYLIDSASATTATLTDIISQHTTPVNWTVP